MNLTMAAMAGTPHQYRVRYQLHGEGKEMFVMACTSGEARDTVKDIIPGALVYSALEVH